MPRTGSRTAVTAPRRHQPEFKGAHMSTLLIVVAIVVVAIVAILVLAASKPATFRLARSTVIKAPAEKIFPLVNDFRRWTAWSPWEKLDADLKRDYGGAENGKGATYGWQGKKSGTGRMEIIESAPPSRVLIKLDFLKPFEAAQHRRIHLHAGGVTVPASTGRCTAQHLHGQAHEHLREHGQARRQGLRERPRRNIRPRPRDSLGPVPTELNSSLVGIGASRAAGTSALENRSSP